MDRENSVSRVGDLILIVLKTFNRIKLYSPLLQNDRPK